MKTISWFLKLSPIKIFGIGIIPIIPFVVLGQNIIEVFSTKTYVCVFGVTLLVLLVCWIRASYLILSGKG